MVVKHHLNEVCNAICSARGGTTYIYVFQAIDYGQREEMEGAGDDSLHAEHTAGELPSSE